MAEAEKTDPRTVRRMAYRLSGTAVALSALNLPIHGISIEGVEDQGHSGKEGYVLFNNFSGRQDQIEFVFIFGNFAADCSGVPKEFDGPYHKELVFSELESYRDDIVQFAERTTGLITRLGEALLASKKLSEDEFYQIVEAEMTRNMRSLRQQALN